MKTKNTINGNLLTKVSLRSKIFFAAISVASGAAIFVVVFFIAQITGTLAPTEDLKASQQTSTPIPTLTEAQLAMDFNGRTTFINAGAPNFGLTNQLTVTAWVRWDTIPSSGNVWSNIATYATKTGYGSGDNGLFWLQHNSDNTKFEFAVQTVNSRNQVWSTTKPIKGVWYHLAGTFDGSKIRIYVNGVLENSINNSGNIAAKTTSHEFHIGEWPNTGNNSRRFNGQIDEVSVWAKELSATEIKKIMCKAIDPSTSKLKAYWNFNDNSSLTKVYDLTSNHYAGNITGAKFVSSGAPVGSQNSYYYTAPAAKFSIKHPNGDSIVFSNFSSQPTGIQLYYHDVVDNDANIGNSPSDLLLTNRKFGTYVVANQPITYNVKYYYKNNPYVNIPGAKAAGGYDPVDLILTSRPSADTIWTKLDATNDVPNMSISFSGINGRTEIALGTSQGQLPIALISFTGKLNGKDVDLNWKTATEINNDFFTIERSADCKTFEKVVKIDGAGNSNMILKYDYTDVNVAEVTKSTKVYYRLKQTDFDGKFTYSGIIGISLTEESTAPFELLSANPNPFQSDIFLSVSSIVEGTAVIKLYDMNGKQVKDQEAEIMEGVNTLTFSNNADLRKGTYMVSVEMNKQRSKVLKVIKY